MGRYVIIDTRKHDLWLKRISANEYPSVSICGRGADFGTREELQEQEIYEYLGGI